MFIINKMYLLFLCYNIRIQNIILNLKAANPQEILLDIINRYTYNIILKCSATLEKKKLIALERRDNV